jgi:hypothetical protein
MYQPLVLLWVQMHADPPFPLTDVLKERGEMRFAFQSQDTTSRQVDMDLWK